MFSCVPLRWGLWRAQTKRPPLCYLDAFFGCVAVCFLVCGFEGDALETFFGVATTCFIMYSSHMWNVFTDVNNIGFNICDTDHKILVGGIFLKITKKFLYKIFCMHQI
jgi:hypothetical protein